jgi:hypothetical protein
MQSKGNTPTAAQLRWREDIRALGCVISREQHGIEIHHVLGATAKHNRQPIGHWFILPLSAWYHRLNPVLNVTDHKRLFEANYGTQVALFSRLLDLYRFEYCKEPPVPAAVIDAIFNLERNGIAQYKQVV